MDEADESNIIAEYISMAGLAGCSGDSCVSSSCNFIECLLGARHCAGTICLQGPPFLAQGTARNTTQYGESQVETK